MNNMKYLKYILPIVCLFVGFGSSVAYSAIKEETLGAGTSIVTENGVEKVVITNQVKLEKQEIKAQIDQMKALKAEAQKKCDQDMSYVNSQLDQLQLLLIQFK